MIASLCRKSCIRVSHMSAGRRCSSQHRVSKRDDATYRCSLPICATVSRGVAHFLLGVVEVQVVQVWQISEHTHRLECIEKTVVCRHDSLVLLACVSLVFIIVDTKKRRETLRFLVHFVVAIVRRTLRRVSPHDV